MKMRVAILGAGNIARSMAAAVRGLQERGEDVEPYAVGARELSRAEAFAKEQGFAKAYGSMRNWSATRTWIWSMWQRPIHAL